MSIERWNANDAWLASGDGEYVKFEDHQAELEEEEAKLEARAETQVEREKQRCDALRIREEVALERAEAAEKALKGVQLPVDAATRFLRHEDTLEDRTLLKSALVAKEQEETHAY